MPNRIPKTHPEPGGPTTPGVAAPNPHWLKLGIAAALGVAAGSMLFATEAQGRRENRRDKLGG